MDEFKQHLKSAKTRATKKGLKFNITLEDLNNLWNQQNGICPYTGWELINFKGKKKYRVGDRMRFASLDRKNSARGYTKRNIQFVSLAVQTAKSEWPENKFIEMCCVVCDNMV